MTVFWFDVDDALLTPHGIEEENQKSAISRARATKLDGSWMGKQVHSIRNGPDAKQSDWVVQV